MPDWTFLHNGAELSIEAERSSTGWLVRLPNGARYEIELAPAPSNAPAGQGSVVRFTACPAEDGATAASRRHFAVPCAAAADGATVGWNGRTYRFGRKSRTRAATAAAADSEGWVLAPTGGVVADVTVKLGDAIEMDQQIAVIEAMKVMTPVLAVAAGVVSELRVERGQRTEQGAVIARIEMASDSRNEEGSR